MEPKRKINRLTEYDYAQSGAYFITICTHGRQKILWDSNTFMEGFLPDRVGKPFGNYTFKLLYNGRDCRGDHWSPALPVLD